MRYLGALFMDVKDGRPALSLGRLGFLLLLIFAGVMWVRGSELPQGMLEMLYTLAGYNAVSKGVAQLAKK